MPQLPKDKKKLEKVELDKLVGKAVQMLTDHAKQCLAEANAFVVKAQQSLVEQTIEHPDNVRQVHEIKPIVIKSDQLKEHLDLLDREGKTVQAINAIAVRRPSWFCEHGPVSVSLASAAHCVGVRLIPISRAKIVAWRCHTWRRMKPICSSRM